MGKVKASFKSIKWRFLLYVPICVVISVLGAYAIGIGTNHIQDWFLRVYDENYSHMLHTDGVIVERTEEGGIGFTYGSVGEDRADLIYSWIGAMQFILIPLWVLGCVFLTGTCFYNREMKKPIDSLIHAAGKIADNELDFQMDYQGNDELGLMCLAFEDMRSALYENNRRMWRALEERKRLNSAFSHDLRTPLTVLQGYVDYLEKYVPEGRVSQEKLLSILAMMNGQVTRLTHYTRKMNAMQKLEDVEVDARELLVSELTQNMRETGEMLRGEKSFQYELSGDAEILVVDRELVMQVYENLLSNAFRYAEQSVEVWCQVQGGSLRIQVCDDGEGFTGEALKQAAEPFFREEKQPDRTHFGLGLYICRILCEKCGGSLKLENGERGGVVTAEFCFAS